MWWRGSKEAVAAAEAAATALVLAEPETVDGVPVPAAERTTTRWAVPFERAGLWYVDAHPAMAVPSGVVAIEEPPPVAGSIEP